MRWEKRLQEKWRSGTRHIRRRQGYDWTWSTRKNLLICKPCALHPETIHPSTLKLDTFVKSRRARHSRVQTVSQCFFEALARNLVVLTLCKNKISPVGRNDRMEQFGNYDTAWQAGIHFIFIFLGSSPN